MMGDLPGVVTEAYSAIIGDGPEPDRTAVSTFLERQPETDVMPPVGALAIRFFEREACSFFTLESKAG